MIITKEREERNRKALDHNGRGAQDEQSEFPKLILEEEGIGKNQ